MTERAVHSITPVEALKRLSEGNRRFLEKGASLGTRNFNADLAEQRQRPFAIVLGCSDSRTPVEILFDEGFGDLFVVRIAGNVVAPSVVGSIEFAAAEFGTQLVVVLGHTRCGAVGATVRAIHSGDGPESNNLRAITNRIAPHVAPLVKRSGPPPTDLALQREAMRANVRASVAHLKHGSELLENLGIDGKLAVVGAEYELETGRVRFLDGVSEDTEGNVTLVGSSPLASAKPLRP